MFITNLGNNPFPVASQDIMALNVLINKWFNNWELIVTVGQPGRLVIRPVLSQFIFIL